jgi:hypothetical protein
MQERVWTVVSVSDRCWHLIHDGHSVSEHTSLEAAIEAGTAAARKAMAHLYPASVLIEEASGLREIFPKRRRKRSEASKRKPRAAPSNAEQAGYDLVYFAGKFRIPMAAARRILERVGPDREKLNAAAREYKSRRMVSS